LSFRTIAFYLYWIFLKDIIHIIYMKSQTQKYLFTIFQHHFLLCGLVAIAAASVAAVL